MRIGIIGTGRIGGTLARHFLDAGHTVALANSRGPQTLRDLVAVLGERAQAATAEQVARFGDVVVVSIPFGHYTDLPADALAGKVVVDTGNYYPDRDGHRADLDEGRTTSSELVQQHLAGARVIKAFNAIRFDDLRDQADRGGVPGRRAIPVSGDDAEAKRIVMGLISQIGFDPVDAGGLADGGRRHQPGTPVYTTDLDADQLRDRLGLTTS